MTSEENVNDWAELLDTAEFPHNYIITEAAVLALPIALLFPWWAAKSMMTNIATGFAEEDSAWIIDQFLPELETAVKDVKVSLFDRISLARMFTGMIMKIIYAFQWQEFFYPRPLLYTAIPQFYRSLTLPLFNF